MTFIVGMDEDGAKIPGDIWTWTSESIFKEATPTSVAKVLVTLCYPGLYPIFTLNSSHDLTPHIGDLNLPPLLMLSSNLLRSSIKICQVLH